MKLALLAVGRPRGHVADAIADYEDRIRRYFRFASVEVREGTGRANAPEQTTREEADRLLARISGPTELVALHRTGRSWSSEELASHLADAGVRSSAGITFVIGGAFGLHPDLLARADLQLSLSGMTLPHELARLVLTEQIYRAGTILRGEPYHKGARG